jgi:uncharacterized protein (TIGR02118 family)
VQVTRVPARRDAGRVITIAFLLRRRDDVGEAEFHRYWREEHGPLVAGFAGALGIRRYVQLHSLDPTASEVLRLSRGCELAHYDGIALVTFDSLDALVAATATEQGHAAGAALLEDEQRFIDLSRSVIWLTDTNVVVA